MIEIKRVLWVTDFSEDAKGALEWAEFLSESFNAQLDLLHVVPDVFLFYNTLLGDPGFWLKALEEAKAKARERLEALARETGGRYHILEGTP